ncbi:MAG: 1-acyl-sn-glycerol-3-phosphate acyltransferase [Lachnospiraceae bacterium]|nr:1-acyl-sn-glycerol-3-phosphate acyltransferase [Lachnospiraceae bacterium]
MIRSILVILLLVLYGIFSIVALPILALVGKINKTARDKATFTIVIATFKMILFLSGIKIIVKGKEKIPTDCAVLYVGNHRSYFDIVSLYTIIAPLAGFVAKVEMKKVPLLNIWMKYMNCLFLDRNDIRQGLKVILEGIEAMKSGISMCIFPEGTRNKAENEAELLPFKEGSLKLAEKSGSPIVPVALHNTINCFEKTFPRIRKTTISIEFGEPIYMDKLEKEERKFLGAKVRDIIIEMLKNTN